MDSNGVLSFIRKPEKSPKSVYDRLYLDFSKRAIESKSMLNSSSVLNPSRSVTTLVRIEDSLMQKHIAAKSKLKVLKARYQAEEMKEVHPVPEINPISRILASKQQDKSRETKSAYIKSILSTSRFSKSNREQSSCYVKTATIRLDDLDLRPNLCKTPQSNSVIQEKNLYLEKLRNAVILRENVLEPEEPPNLLEMDVVNRGKYWNTLKRKHLQEIEQEMTERGMEGCTFSPALTPRMNISRRKWANASRSTPRANSVNTSYSQIFLNKKQYKNFDSTKNSFKYSQAKTPVDLKSDEHASNNRSIQYTQLSPSCRKFAYKAGINMKKFIAKARPMLTYKSAKIF